MHAHLHQLLSLRNDEPVDADVRRHVQQCAQCLAESERLAQSRERLRALPTMDAPEHLWHGIEARLESKRRLALAPRIAATLVVLVGAALTYVVLLDEAPKPQATVEQAPEAKAQDDVQQLMAQSRDLERLLQYLPDRPQVEQVSTAVTVDSLEQRIQWLDWQLANGADAGLDQRQAQRLWSERVDLMDSLVKVRYAESAPMLL